MNNELLHKIQIKGGINYFNRGSLHMPNGFTSYSGHDIGSRTNGYTFLPGGMPSNPRHRKFLGIVPPRIR